MPAVLGTRPAATRMSLPSIVCSPEGVRTVRLTSSPDRPCTLQGLGRQQEFDAFVAEDPLHLLGDVGILPAHELRPGLDDRHAAAEATIGLRQFEADIAAAEHDQMRRQVVELQRLDMRERPGRLEAGNVRDGRVRSDVEEDLLAGQHARAAVVQAHLERLRRHEAPGRP